jgi:Na+-transporting NADH:ubiquinone oxidoreductase subunit NqrF
MKKSKEERLKAREEYKKRSDKLWNYIREKYEQMHKNNDYSFINKTLEDVVWEMLKDEPQQVEEFVEYADFLDMKMLVFNYIGGGEYGSSTRIN